MAGENIGGGLEGEDEDRIDESLYPYDMPTDLPHEDQTIPEPQAGQFVPGNFVFNTKPSQTDFGSINTRLGVQVTRSITRRKSK
jgi:hypothetical protein